jgi:hypothetical protein
LFGIVWKEEKRNRTDGGGSRMKRTLGGRSLINSGVEQRREYEFSGVTMLKADITTTALPHI